MNLASQPETSYEAFRTKCTPGYSLSQVERSVPPRKLEHHANRQEAIQAMRNRCRTASGIRTQVKTHYTEFRERMNPPQAQQKGPPVQERAR